MSPTQPWNAAFWQHFPEQAQSAAGLASATVDFYRRHPSPFIKISPAGTAIACGFGLRDEWQGDHLGRMTVVHRPVEILSDWERIIHNGPGVEVREYLLESARLVLRAADVPVLQTVFNPLTIASQLAGPALLRNHLQSEPALMRHVLSTLSRYVCALITELSGCGVHGIYLATQTAAYTCFSPAGYEKWAQSGDEQCMAAAGSLPCNILHLHGDGVHLPFPVLSPNWVVHYEWSARNPPFEALAQISSAPVFVGASQALLVNEACNATLRNLSSILNGRPAVLTPGCCLPLRFPEACLQEWRAAIAHFSMK